MKPSLRKFGLVCLLSIQPSPSQQNATFLLEPDRPFVYIKFDHAGEAL